MRKTNSPFSTLTLTLSSAGRAEDLYCLLTLSRVIITARQCSRCRSGHRLPGRRVGDGPGPAGARRGGGVDGGGALATVAGGLRRRGVIGDRRSGGRRVGLVGRRRRWSSSVWSSVVAVVVVVGGRPRLLHVRPRHPGVVRVGHEAGRHDLRGSGAGRLGAAAGRSGAATQSDEERHDQPGRRGADPTAEQVARPARSVRFGCPVRSSLPDSLACGSAAASPDAGTARRPSVTASAGVTMPARPSAPHDQHAQPAADLELLARQRARDHAQVDGVELDALHAHQLRRVEQQIASAARPPSPCRRRSCSTSLTWLRSARGRHRDVDDGAGPVLRQVDRLDDLAVGDREHLAVGWTAAW